MPVAKPSLQGGGWLFLGAKNLVQSDTWIRRSNLFLHNQKETSELVLRYSASKLIMAKIISVLGPLLRQAIGKN